MSDRQKRPQEIEVAPWVVLVTFLIGWGLGGGTVAFEVVSGQDNVAALVMGGWLICLPLIATNPVEVLRKLLGGNK